MKGLPKTWKELHALLAEAHQTGYAKAMDEARSFAAQQKAELARKEKLVHLDALQACTKLASGLGQAIGELARAMQSEKGQL